jgi:hypothetical protein
MGTTEGVVLIAIAIVMIFLARTTGFMSRYIQVYIVGQIYVMTAMVLGVIGVAFVISGLAP